jgi:Protein of unknown function (DUF3108)
VNHRALFLPALPLTALLLMMATPRSGAQAEPGPTIRPHTALYRVTVKGIGAGTFELRLRAVPPAGHYRYETIPHPVLLARLFVSADSRELSEFHLGPAGVVPDSYHLDDGGSHRDDIRMQYDWERGRVTGTRSGQPLDLGISAGTQDVMSIRAAILYDLAAGKTATEYAMIDQGEIKSFVYHAVGRETITTPQGSYETLVWTSARKGSDGRDKTWKYWYAPALGFLPVRAAQLEDGHTRLLFELERAKLEP